MTARIDLASLAGCYTTPLFGSQCISGAEPFPEAKNFTCSRAASAEASQDASSLRDIYLHIQFKFTVPGLRMKCHLRRECIPLWEIIKQPLLILARAGNHTFLKPNVGYLHPRNTFHPLGHLPSRCHTGLQPQSSAKSYWRSQATPRIPSENVMITGRQGWEGSFTFEKDTYQGSKI